MVNDMAEWKLETIEQIPDFLAGVAADFGDRTCVPRHIVLLGAEIVRS